VPLLVGPAFVRVNQRISAALVGVNQLVSVTLREAGPVEGSRLDCPYTEFLEEEDQVLEHAGLFVSVTMMSATTSQ
jgi:hypothetical protein